MYKAYVDGSYKDGKVGWGAIIIENDKVYGEFSGTMTEDEVDGTRQVAGELRAVLEVLFWCDENNVEDIEIYYDYQGIKDWVTGAWRAKKRVTQNYRDKVLSYNINIKWVKVKSHSGDYYNDKVDELAKKMVN